MLEDDPPAPDSIGPFRVLRRLGEGGMAETWEGVRDGPGGFAQRVCVKRVRPGLVDLDLQRLFLREARVLSELSHRNITRVLDFGEDGGELYLALELVDGLDLRALVRRQPGHRLPVALAALIGLELAEALEHAHERSIAHRDVSPSNVMISRDGDVKLTDFGISKAMRGSFAASHVIRGNLWYMAPERMDPHAPATMRSDLFSLGVLLFECLTGERPFSIPPHVAALGGPPPRSLRALAPDAPEGLVEVVERLIALDPADRYPDARTVAERLAPLIFESAARRSLRDLVAAPEPRAPREAEEAATWRELGASPPGIEEVPERWQRYAFAPGVWADASRAAAMRRRAPQTTTPPGRAARSHSSPALPPAWRSPVWVVALGALGLFVGSAAILLIAALLSG